MLLCIFFIYTSKQIGKSYDFSKSCVFWWASHLLWSCYNWTHFEWWCALVLLLFLTILGLTYAFLGLTYAFLCPTKLQSEFDGQDCIIWVEAELKFLHLPKVCLTEKTCDIRDMDVFFEGFTVTIENLFLILVCRYQKTIRRYLKPVC